MSLNCPTCGEKDQVRKLNLAAESGHSYGYHDDGSNYNIWSGDRLSLLPPSRTDASGYYMLLGVWIFAGILVVGFTFSQGDIFAFTVCGSTFFILGVLLYFVEILPANKRFDNWQKKMAVYRLLYYCSRDDTIFMPDGSAAFTPDKLDQYLNEVIRN